MLSDEPASYYSLNGDDGDGDPRAPLSAHASASELKHSAQTTPVPIGDVSYIPRWRPSRLMSGDTVSEADAGDYTYAGNGGLLAGYHRWRRNGRAYARAHTLSADGRAATRNGGDRAALLAAPAQHTKRWAWRHTIAYWVCINFLIGSALFVAAGFFDYQGEAAESPVRQKATIDWPYFVGGVFFLLGGYLGYLESINVLSNAADDRDGDDDNDATDAAAAADDDDDDDDDIDDDDGDDTGDDVVVDAAAAVDDAEGGHGRPHRRRRSRAADAVVADVDDGRSGRGRRRRRSAGSVVIATRMRLFTCARPSRDLWHSFWGYSAFTVGALVFQVAPSSRACERRGNALGR